MNQRRNEALRAYLYEGGSLQQAADATGYIRAAVASLVRDLRAGKLTLFAPPAAPGRKSAPERDAARSRVIELHREGLSVYEISTRLAREGTPLGRSGVCDILREEGFGRLLRGPRAAAGLSILPEKTALTDYSYRLSHDHQQRFPGRPGQADDRRGPGHPRRGHFRPGLSRRHALGRRPRATTPHESAAVTLTSYPGTVRQLIVTGLGREAPTVIITNDTHITAKALIEHYARRMTIEQRLAEIIQAFCADALSSAVNLNVDLDIVLCVLAQARTAAFRVRLPGNYAHATPRHPPAPFPGHPGRDHQQRAQHHRQDQPSRILTRPAPRPAPRRHHRPLVGRTPAPLRVRLSQGPKY
ncbi:MAG: hypothetical protein ACM3ML_18480, partial [Micromonosporaceae bacterium]